VLQEMFAHATVKIPAIDVQPDGSRIETLPPVPRYLFRGEPDQYPDCLPAWFRLDRSHELDRDDRLEVRLVTERAINWFCSPESNFNLPEHHASGLVQHLGLPTRYIDFSADPEIAATFALGNCPAPNRRAAICVLDVKTAIDSRCGRITELINHPWCERAKRQTAHGFAPLLFSDLRLLLRTNPVGAVRGDQGSSVRLRVLISAAGAPKAAPCFAADPPPSWQALFPCRCALCMKAPQNRSSCMT
jgi:hypothetical protein